MDRPGHWCDNPAECDGECRQHDDPIAAQASFRCLRGRLKQGKEVPVKSHRLIAGRSQRSPSSGALHRCSSLHRILFWFSVSLLLSVSLHATIKSGSWSPAGTMGEPRTGASATLLHDGGVLI